jgi:hypothetical protein
VAKLVDALDLGSSAARRGGSIPFIRTKKARPEGRAFSFFRITFAPHFATLAQLVEHRIRNARVVGSSPMSGSRGDNGSFTRAEHARVLKLVDRLDSGSSVRKDVGVRAPLRAPRKNPESNSSGFFIMLLWVSLKSP